MESLGRHLKKDPTNPRLGSRVSVFPRAHTMRIRHSTWFDRTTSATILVQRSHQPLNHHCRRYGVHPRLRDRTTVLPLQELSFPLANNPADEPLLPSGTILPLRFVLLSPFRRLARYSLGSSPFQLDLGPTSSIWDGIRCTLLPDSVKSIVFARGRKREQAPTGKLMCTRNVQAMSI